jgi:hypothetical protein
MASFLRRAAARASEFLGLSVRFRGPHLTGASHIRLAPCSPRATPPTPQSTADDMDEDDARAGGFAMRREGALPPFGRVFFRVGSLFLLSAPVGFAARAPFRC